MKKETFMAYMFLLSWMLLIGIVGMILQYDVHFFDSDLAQHVLFFIMMFGPITNAFVLTKLKLYQQKKKGCNDGDKIED